VCRQFLYCLALCVGLQATSYTLAAAPTTDPIVGRWLIESGEAVIEIYPCADLFCGKIVWIAHPPPDGSQAKDRRNPDEKLRARPICGMEMLGNFHRSEPKRLTGGWIYSAETGQTFKAKITLEARDTLLLRGYVGIPLFGQSQTWTRADPGFPPCGHA